MTLPARFMPFSKLSLNVTQSTLKPLLALAALFFLAGCVTPKPGGSVNSIAVDQVRTAPPETAQAVRWGGTITSVQNLEDGRTSIEIMSRPLASSGRPLHNDNTDGRFIAEVNEVLDPALITAGRDITVVGLVGEELRDGTIGKSSYTFPVVNVDDYHFWNPKKQYNNYCYYCDYGYGYGSHRYGLGYYGFGYRHGHYGLYHRYSRYRHLRPYRGYRSNARDHQSQSGYKGISRVRRNN